MYLDVAFYSYIDVINSENMLLSDIAWLLADIIILNTRSALVFKFCEKAACNTSAESLYANFTTPNRALAFLKVGSTWRSSV